MGAPGLGERGAHLSLGECERGGVRLPEAVARDRAAVKRARPRVLGIF